MELFTIQLAKHRYATDLGIPVIDTTVKSGRFYLAPTWDMVMGFKAGTITVTAYTKLYEDRMLQMFRTYREDWEEVLAKPTMALACMCGPNRFCHRHLLKDIFRRICAKRGMEFIDRGEITAASVGSHEPA